MPLLEREVALHDLEAALNSAVDGDGRLALVSGEAGIGKTSLVHEFARGHQKRVRVLHGGCDALFTPRPLGPLHDIAEQVGGALADVLSGPAAQRGAFGALLAELQRVPTIAVVEDIHWADDATLDVLRYVGRRIGRTPTVLVLTYRDDEITGNQPLRALLGDFAALAATHRIQLQALSETAVVTMAGDRDIDVHALHRQTGGNPFFLTEILSNTGPALPMSVRDAVLGRIASLTSAARLLLDAAAIVGSRIELWLLQTVVPDQFQGLDECLACGVLVEQAEGVGFRHELARDAINAAIPPVRRSDLHRRVLRALEAAPTGRTDLSRLAHHAQGANEQDALLTYLPAAARQAAAAGAHRAAADLLANGLRRAAGLQAANHAALLEAHAMESYHIADLPGAIGSWRQAIDIRHAQGDRRREGMNLAVLATTLASGGRRDEARQASQAAIDLLSTLPPGRELALAYGTQAILHQYRHELADAMTLAQRAITLAEGCGDNHITVVAYDTLGMSCMFLDYERGCRYLEHAAELAREAGLDMEVARAYGDLGAVSVALFQMERAERYLADGLAFTADRDLDRTRLYTLGWMSAAHLFRGRWSEAAACANEVLNKPASSSARVVALVTLGRLHARRGDSAEASRLLDEALLIAGSPDEVRLIGPVHAARAEAAALLADAAASRTEVDAVYELVLQKRHQWLAGELAYWRRRAGCLDRPPDWIAPPFALQIEGSWRAAADAWRLLGCPYEEARALADGDPAAQERALAVFDGLGARPAAAELRRAMRARGLSRVPRGPRPTTRANPFGLTVRQLEILELLAEGLTNAEIGGRMSITAKTAEHHVAAVLAKLDVASRQAAVLLARDEQLIL